ncbi:uncharacterized protein PAC_06677 [Phialocephala subalpina]|uniref:Uncharacterized protein n=1 Tax=Phialocephala subalpina TaxID=576137 RepID=A0A1L7WVI1_9HELO|nr:uncharacterized protein PAC_06677 [Phialocephala subalpina]
MTPPSSSKSSSNTNTPISESFLHFPQGTEPLEPGVLYSTPHITITRDSDEDLHLSSRHPNQNPNHRIAPKTFSAILGEKPLPALSPRPSLLSPPPRSKTNPKLSPTHSTNYTNLAKPDPKIYEWKSEDQDDYEIMEMQASLAGRDVRLKWREEKVNERKEILEQREESVKRREEMVAYREEMVREREAGVKRRSFGVRIEERARDERGNPSDSGSGFESEESWKAGDENLEEKGKNGETGKCGKKWWERVLGVGNRGGRKLRKRRSALRREDLE